MAQALAAGLAASGALQPGQIGACARDRAKLHRNTEPHGFLAFDDAAGVAGFADVVVVAVKPYQVEAVLAPVKGMLAGKVVVSVAAGMTFDRYEEILAPGTHHLSTIPNTPVAVFGGETTFICYGEANGTVTMLGNPNSAYAGCTGVWRTTDPMPAA